MAVADMIANESDDSEWIPDNQLFVICQILMAFFYPPIAVFLERGAGCDLVINFILTCFLYVPGIIHALYIVLTYEAILKAAKLSRPASDPEAFPGSADKKEEQWTSEDDMEPVPQHPGGYDSPYRDKT